jgi:hypothetical protein
VVEELATNGQPDSLEDAEPLSSAGSGKRTIQRSTIQFPYGDLDDAVVVAKAIYDGGGQSCALHQLAPWMGHDSVSSGAFRLKLATARIFGLVDVTREWLTLTPLGRRIVDPHTERQARAEAFLHVPLYRDFFERYKGMLLPRDVALEREMAALGVASKQTDKARQAFQRSADQAGFFSHGRDRLVMPSVGTAGAVSSTANSPLPPANPPPAPPAQRDRPGHYGDGGGGEPPKRHPFIQGLFETLPDAGADWPPEAQRDWLDTAEQVFKLIYNKNSRPPQP